MWKDYVEKSHSLIFCWKYRLKDLTDDKIKRMRLLCFDAGKSHLFMMEYLVKGYSCWWLILAIIIVLPKFGFLVWALVARLVSNGCSSHVHRFPITWSPRDRLVSMIGTSGGDLWFCSCRQKTWKRLVGWTRINVHTRRTTLMISLGK